MMSAKLATLDLLKIKIFWNNGYEAVISVNFFLNDVTNKILSRDSSYIVDVVMWPNLVTSISMREVIITTIL